ncbi:T9SS type A sorting domain-containing protein [Polaribacter litorisediminis]|uniref:T9SS type A sorting domain-containing protein n=1 Tax=Polaribacter litorisediminis TaxID=1908341 RepID=UPI001CC18CE5|nr:T9SS type A sorting domain-containing protein [Polaribacter litorisediminis]UAM98000.1 T9SS type A sorting domain-containing protein [Polaribacter litorisediminis]
MRALCVIISLFSCCVFHMNAQVVLFDDTAQAATFNVGQNLWSSLVANPLRTQLNSSATVISNNSSASWQGISGNCAVEITNDTRIFHIQFLNLSRSGNYQIQFSFDGSSDKYFFSGNYDLSEWTSQVIDLSEHIGKTLSWFIIYPSSNEVTQTYIDNLYLDGNLSEPISEEVIAQNHSFNNLEVGIPLLTNDQARLGFTEMMSEYKLETTSEAVNLSMDRSEWEQALRINFNDFNTSSLDLFMDEVGTGVHLDFANNPWASIVSNPLSDAVNTSSYVIENNPTSSWKGISGTLNALVTDTSVFNFQLYNPNGAGNYQVQLFFEGDVSNKSFNGVYNGGQWENIQIDLSAYAGKKITWFWIAPTSGVAEKSYFDEIHITSDKTISGQEASLLVSTFSTLDAATRLELPAELSNLNGISFKAKAIGMPISLDVEVRNDADEVLHAQTISVSTEWASYELPFTAIHMRQIKFSINSDNQVLGDTNAFASAILLDDLYLLDDTVAPFSIPTEDEEVLQWLKESAIRYFIWHYIQLDEDRGVVQEISSRENHVQLSGLGMSIAAFVLAEKEGMLSPVEAKTKISSILNWLNALDVNNGVSGVLGFPQHWMNFEGIPIWQNISTIDWAMCAAGIRIAKQKYNDDASIVAIADALLDKPQWDQILTENGRIPKALDTSGNPIDGEWGDAFSEETELIYTEAIASGKLDSVILDKIIRIEKKGFFPSWFGAGFTYNWLQLWTGTLGPFIGNSKKAYEFDAKTSLEVLGLPLIGLTACGTVSNVDENGFVSYDSYISNQGSEAHGSLNSNEVIQISPAPYGAVLAYPFLPSSSMTALRAYGKTGYFHPLLGFPDNIRMKELPGGLNEKWAPNWERFDINTAAIAMAIEQVQDNTISNLMLSDLDFKTALEELILNTQLNTLSIDKEEIEDGPLIRVSVYPNPSQGIFTIELPPSLFGEVDSFQVIDLSGNILFTKKIVTKEAQIKIDLRNFASRVYILRLPFVNKVQTVFLVKK